MRALVTGSEGFIGRHFAAELRQRGYEVQGLDTKITDSQDCRAFFRSRYALRDHFDLVVHAAAVVKGRETIDGAPLATAANLGIDADMFRWASLAQPGRVIYFSSSAIYPVWHQTGEPTSATTVSGLAEHMVKVTRDSGVSRPDQVYGWSKVMGEVLAGELRRTGVPVTVVRPFSGYGADQDTTYPFPAFIERARRKADPFEVWCGSCVRDFIHVDDIVAGTLAIAADGTEDPVNLCTGRGVSFTTLAQMVIETRDAQLGAQVSDTSHHWEQQDLVYVPGVVERADKPTGVQHRVGNTLRMERIYKPSVMLEEGIQRALGA
jgi:nucleoside-diphosphate-sugar epimerase